jgi:predicted dehydrogenase
VNILKLKKIYRYALLLGFRRALVKAISRSKKNILFKSIFFFDNRSIGLVGCGQFQFSTIAYFLSRGFTNRFLFCYDLDNERAKYLASYYLIKKIPLSLSQINDNKLKVVYIASNHSSHTDYSIFFLNKNINVYCEKPISVSFSQFDSLLYAINKSKAKFYAGYNRPYAPAITYLKNIIKKRKIVNGKFTLNCFVSAHFISKDHWYRNPEEGTRICGNLGHWIDLMIHIYNWRGFIPESYRIQIAYSDEKELDDNIAISITTQEGDITSIIITSRSEPFEGINETINLQFDSVIAKIDDFRNMTIWDSEKLYKKKYYRKNVGHKNSVLQPYISDIRDFKEVIASTELMLHVANMVCEMERERTVKLIR